MEYLQKFIDLFIHLDVHLAEMVEAHGTWSYLILFAIVFCETGLVVTPFLPGDSLLFSAGAIAALGPRNPPALVAGVIAAALCGDAVNYHIGRFLGPAVLRHEGSRLFNRRHLDRTQDFYRRYGGKTVVLARFAPIIRTFAPFLAGVGQMPFARFAAFSVTGAVLWATIGVYAGYWFGNVPFVKKHFSLVILAIVGVSLLPAAIGMIRSRKDAPSDSP